MDVKARLKKLVADSGRSLSVLAKEAKVPYYPLQRFVKGDTVTYDVESAAKLYQHLTGKPLIEEEAA